MIINYLLSQKNYLNLCVTLSLCAFVAKKHSLKQKNVSK